MDAVFSPTEDQAPRLPLHFFFFKLKFGSLGADENCPDFPEGEGETYKKSPK